MCLKSGLNFRLEIMFFYIFYTQIKVKNTKTEEPTMRQYILKNIFLNICNLSYVTSIIYMLNFVKRKAKESLENLLCKKFLVRYD